MRKGWLLGLAWLLMGAGPSPDDLGWLAGHWVTEQHGQWTGRNIGQSRAAG